MNIYILWLFKYVFSNNNLSNTLLSRKDLSEQTGLRCNTWSYLVGTDCRPHALRKTLAHRIFELEGKDMKAMILVSQLPYHSGIKGTTTLGVGDKQIEQVYYSL